jgi:phenylacetate-coenzyme A ligase PaaK-like adenylate-forming protein
LLLVEDELRRTLAGLDIARHRFLADREQTFRAFFDDITRRVPAYAQAEWRGSQAATIEALPILSRSDIARAPEAFLRAESDDEIIVEWTSGTTGAALRIEYDLCAAALLNTRLYDIVVSRCPSIRRRLVAGTVAVALVSNKPERHSLPIVLPALSGTFWQRFSLTDDADETEQTLRSLAAADPPILYGKTWYLLQLIDYLTTASIQLAPGCVLTSGDGCYAGDHERLAEFFGAPVIDAYTSTEVGIVAVSNPGSTELIVDDELVFLEVIGEDGLIACAGEGELVVTSLFNWHNPFMRYRTGDAGVVDISSDGRQTVRNIRRLGEHVRLGPNGVTSERVDQVFASHGIWDARLRLQERAGYLIWAPRHGGPHPNEAALADEIRVLLDLEFCRTREVARVTQAGSKRLRYPRALG